jgi:hypothetical protein
MTFDVTLFRLESAWFARRHCQTGIETSRVTTNMSYREELPPSCPPEAAEEIAVARDVFRLVRSNLPSPDDFRSLRAENPRAVYSISECQVRGLSVFAVRTDSEKALKLPKFRGRQICRVTLRTGSGRIQQTGRPSHHTWWPLAAFDILANCAVESV